MDEIYGWILLATPILLVVTGYLLGWRGKTPALRKGGIWMVAGICGLFGLFSSWWVLGMMYGMLFESGDANYHIRPNTIAPLVAFCGFVLMFPLGAFYLAIRFAKIAMQKNQVTATK